MRLAMLLGVVMLSGCGTNDPVARLPLTDGRHLGDLAGSLSATVVLLYSPTHCFSCDGLLAEWRKLGRDSNMDVVLVLTSPPTSDQEATLALRRFPVAGIVAKDGNPPTGPTAYFFRGRTLADSAVGEAQQALLLRDLLATVGDGGRT